MHFCLRSNVVDMLELTLCSVEDKAVKVAISKTIAAVSNGLDVNNELSRVRYVI